MTRDEIFELVNKERIRQDAKWGGNRELANLLFAAILGEEVGEVNNAILEDHLYEYGSNSPELTAELVQVAAVCVAWLEGLDKAQQE